MKIKELIAELNRLKEQFLYHKAIVGYIPPEMPKPDPFFIYWTGGYYRTKARVKIFENGLSREEHNEASHGVNQWFLVHCAELIQIEMKKKDGFNKVYDKKVTIHTLTYCQLLYALRDKLAHGIYRVKQIGDDLPKPYLASQVSAEILRRFPFDTTLDTNNKYSLPVDVVVIPLLDKCIEEIEVHEKALKSN